MEQPERCSVKDKEHLVFKLKKSLWVQASTKTMVQKLVEHGFEKTTLDYCVFLKKFSEDNFILLLLNANDMLIVGCDAEKIKRLKGELSKSFSTKELGPVKQILRIKISYDRKNKKLWLSQERYIEKDLDRFNMGKSKQTCFPHLGHFKLSSK